MDYETQMIRHQMEETRTSLTDKLETLEQQVVDTVQGTTTAVSDTVENVKEVVQETVTSVKDSVADAVQAVKDTFNIERQVDQHPWPMVGASVAVGYLVGRFFDGSAGPGKIASPLADSNPSDAGPARKERNGSSPQNGFAAHPTGKEGGPTLSAGSSDHGWLGSLGDTLAPEIKKLKAMALSVMIGMVRDLAVGMVPDHLGPPVKELLDHVTTKLGGEALPQPIFKQPVSPEEDQQQGDSAPLLEREKKLGQFD